MTPPGNAASIMISYTVQFAEQLDDEVVARVAKQIIEPPGAYLPAEEMYTRIAEALASGEALTDDDFRQRHSEQEFRGFLARVARRMDELRPWPVPPFRKVDPLSWPDLPDARLIARVMLGIVKVEERLSEPFGRDGEGREVIALRLANGTEVALVADWWPGSHSSALVQRDPSLPPARVLEDFCGATGIRRDEVKAIDPAGG